jgi:phytanoyl-CoA hydroxylase
MLHVLTRYGLPPEYRISVAVQEAGDPDFADSSSSVRKRYEDLGYVIVRKLLEPSVCDAVVAAFRSEVKPFRGPLLRQASMRVTAHQFTSDGFMANALLGIQDLVDPAFRRFRASAIEVVAGPATQTVIGDLLAEAPLLVESMFFESTLVGVPLHADGDYMDSDVPGTMLGAWFALEDIFPLAGRFVIVPRTHSLGRDTRSAAAAAYREFRDRQARTSAIIGSDDKANVQRRFEEAALLHRALIECGLPIIAPMLNKGDALFWSAAVVHGSLPPGSRGLSRNSLTAHYIADSRAFIAYGKRVDFRAETHHGMRLRIMRESNQT